MNKGLGGTNTVLYRMNSRLERHSGAVGLALCLLYLLVSLGLAGRKLLWYDELITLKTAQLPRWQDVVQFYNSGLDTTSPLASLLVHFSLKLPADAEISARLPFVFAFLVMLIGMYLFVHRRYPASYALAAVSLPLSAPLWDMSVEARGYAIVYGCTAVAMIFWQNAIAGRNHLWKVVGVWLALAVAINAHLFAVFLFVPFAAAQLVRDHRKQVDWSMWAAFFLFPLGLLPVLHGERLASKAYGSTFWSAPHLGRILEPYRDYLQDKTLQIFVVLLALAIIAFGARRLSQSVQDSSVSTSGFSAPEWTLVVVLSMLPLYALPASYLIHVYRSHYVLEFAIGVSIVVIAALAERLKRQPASGALLLLLLTVTTIIHCGSLLLAGLKVVAHPRHVHAQLQSAYDSQAWVQTLEQSPLQVLASDHIVYSQLAYYAPADLEKRLYFATDQAELKQYPLSSTGQTNFLLFGDRLSYRSMDIRSFLNRNPHFLFLRGSDPFVFLPQFMHNQEAAGRATLKLKTPEYPSEYEVYDTSFGDVH